MFLVLFELLGKEKIFKRVSLKINNDLLYFPGGRVWREVSDTLICAWVNE